MTYVAELQCFLCGSAAGSIETDRKPMPPDALWHPATGGQPVRVPDWHQLRCSRCGGALLVESIDVMARPEDSEELRRAAPRRGRPPKWLVEQRRRDRDSAESRQT